MSKETRRDFLKGGGLLLLGMTQTGPLQAAANSGQPQWAMIIDLNRCTGCRSCVIACKAHNKTIKGRFITRIISREVGTYPATRPLFTPVQCNHCEDPPCLTACPHGAILKLQDGIVVTDWDRCQGEGSCVKACPYGARFQDPRHGNRSDKCDFCKKRLEKGLLPVCVEACPSRARIFGDLKDPQGEFLTYIKGTKFFTRKPQLKITTRVLYVPLKGEEGKSL